MRAKNFIYISLILMIVVSATLIGAVRAPVIPTIYVDPSTATAQPGETFSIDIKIEGVTTPGVSGWELMIRFDRGLLHTELAWIIEGDFLTSVGMTLFSKVEKPAESAWLIGSALMIPATASGSGTLVTMQFEAQDEGATSLEIISSDLRDINVMPIEHTVGEHGYFSNIVIGNLVRKSAWPEHHHFSISKDEDGIQTLYGKVRNLGEGHGYLRCNFTIWDMGGLPTTFIAKREVGGEEIKTLAGEIVDLSIGLWESRDTAWQPGKYSVQATCLYSADGVTWNVGTKAKTFTFSIVG